MSVPHKKTRRSRLVLAQAAQRALTAPPGVAGLETLEARRLLAVNPVAHAGGPYVMVEGQSVQLNASASYDLDGDTLNFAWDINGDGTFGEYVGQVDPTLTYQDLRDALAGGGFPFLGDYGIGLRVTDGTVDEFGRQRADLSFANLRLNNAAPVVSIAADAPAYLEGQDASFSAIVNDVRTATGPFNYLWSADINGQALNLSNLNTTGGTLTLPQGFIPDDGVMRVTVTVEDPDGAITTQWSEYQVSNRPPTFLSPILVAGTLQEDRLLTISAPASDVAGDTLVYSWSAMLESSTGSMQSVPIVPIPGDSGPATLQAPDNGLLHLTVTVDDGDGAVIMASRTIALENRNPAISGPNPIPVTLNPSAGGTLISADAPTVSDAPGDQVSFRWDYYSGEPTAGNFTFLRSVGTAQQVSLTETAAGSYFLIFRAFDEDGGANLRLTQTFNVDAATTDTASIIYSGEYDVTVPAGESSVNVSLTATLTDLDGLGDITRATVTFFNAENNQQIGGAVSVAEILGTGSLTGQATTSYLVSLDGDSAKLLYIRVQIGGGYASESATAVLAVARPDSGRITGGGSLINTGSAGLFAGATDTLTYFGFHARYHPQSGTVSGGFEMTYTGTDQKVYSVSATNVNSLSTWTDVAAGHRRAAVGATVDVYDITDPLLPQLVHLGARLSMTLTDAGNNGRFDTISFGVWGLSATQPLFASLWNGTSVVEQTLTDGNLKVWDQ